MIVISGSIIFVISLTYIGLLWREMAWKTRFKIKLFIVLFLGSIVFIIWVIYIISNLAMLMPLVNTKTIITSQDIATLLNKTTYYTYDNAAVATEQSKFIEGAFQYVPGGSFFFQAVGGGLFDFRLRPDLNIPKELISDYLYAFFFYSLELGDMHLLAQSLAEMIYCKLNVSEAFLCQHISGYMALRILEIDNDFGRVNISLVGDAQEIILFFTRIEYMAHCVTLVQDFRQFEMVYFWEELLKRDPSLYIELHRMFQIERDTDYRLLSHLIQLYHTPDEWDALFTFTYEINKFGRYCIFRHMRGSVPFYNEGNPVFPDMAFAGNPWQRGFTPRVRWRQGYRHPWWDIMRAKRRFRQRRYHTIKYHWAPNKKTRDWHFRLRRAYYHNLNDRKKRNDHRDAVWWSFRTGQRRRRCYRNVWKFWIERSLKKGEN